MGGSREGDGQGGGYIMMEVKDKRGQKAPSRNKWSIAIPSACLMLPPPPRPPIIHTSIHTDGMMDSAERRWRDGFHGFTVYQGRLISLGAASDSVM